MFEERRSFVFTGDMDVNSNEVRNDIVNLDTFSLADLIRRNTRVMETAWNIISIQRKYVLDCGKPKNSIDKYDGTRKLIEWYGTIA